MDDGNTTSPPSRRGHIPDGLLHAGEEARNIEVKGRAGQGAIRMEANEWKQACHLGERYWLYVVFDCATPSPRLLRVRDPLRLHVTASTIAFLVEADSPLRRIN